MNETNSTSGGGGVGELAADPLSEWTTKKVNGVTHLKLSQPFKTADGEVTELVIRPPLGKHVRMMDTSNENPDQFLEMAGDLCDLTRNQIDNLPAPDAMRVVTVIAAGFGDGSPAGSG